MKRLIIWLDNLIYPILTLICRGRKSDIKKKTVLVLRTDVLGDNLIFLDMAKNFRDIFPREEYKLYYFCQNKVKSVFDDTGFFDEYITFDYSGEYSQLKRVLCRLRGLWTISWQQFDLVINTEYWREPYLSDAFVRFTRAAQKIGMKGYRADLYTDKYYTKLIDINPKGKHILEVHAEFLSKLTGHTYQPEIQILPEYSNIEGMVFQKPYVVICPGASGEIKRWPIERYVEVAKLLQEEFGLTIAICGGSAEKELGTKAEKDLIDFEIVNCIGQTSFKQYTAILRGASIVICNNSSAVHLSAATRTPAIVIVGAIEGGLLLPYKSYGGAESVPVSISYPMDCGICNWKCDKKKEDRTCAPCIDNVTVEEVYLAARRILK